MAEWKSATEVYEAEMRDSVSLNTLPFAIRSRLGEFTGAELKVYLCLLGHANVKSLRTWAGLSLVRRETGLSEHGVTMAIAGLVRKRWIKRFGTRDPKTNQRRASTTFCKFPLPVRGTHWARIVERMQRGL
jgi:hypothetical protein